MTGCSGDIYIGGGETEAVKLIAQIVCELRTAYPEIHYHLYSGNAEDLPNGWIKAYWILGC